MASELNALLLGVVKDAHEGKKLDEQSIILAIENILSRNQVVPLHLADTIENEPLSFSPLFWLGSLRLDQVAIKLLEEQKNGTIELNLAQFEEEREHYAQESSFSGPFLKAIKKAKKTETEKEDDEFDFDKIGGESDDFDVMEPSTSSQTYNQYERWDINKGFNPEIFQILIPQLAKRGESLFALNNVYSIEPPDIQGKSHVVPFSFRTNDDRRNILYLPPTRIDFETYTRNEAFDEKENPDIAEYLKYIKESCPMLARKTRFIIPLNESPKPKGVSHSILLCVDYDPATRSLTPVVFDSLTRGVVSHLSKYVTWQQHKTCDTLLRSAFDKTFSSDFTVSPLVRYAYGHQNRVSEGNCGSYTFRLAQMAADQYANYDTLKGLYDHIPTPNGWISADNFLTPAHVHEITRVVRANTSESPESLYRLPKVDVISNNETAYITENLIKDLFLDQSQIDKIQNDIIGNIDDLLSSQQGTSFDSVLNIAMESNVKDDEKSFDEIIRQLTGQLGGEENTESERIPHVIQAMHQLKQLKDIRDQIIAEIEVQNSEKEFPLPPEMLPLTKFSEYQRVFDELSVTLKMLNVTLPDDHIAKNRHPIQEHPALVNYARTHQILQGKYPLHYALCYDEASIKMYSKAKYMNERLNGKTPLYLAVELGNTEAVKTLYALGANIDGCGPYNDSAFVVAARLGRSEIVMAILDARASSWTTSGMSRKAQDAMGRTAFHYLAKNGDIACCKKFIESITRGSYSDFTDILDHNGESALHILAKKGNIELLEMINNTKGYSGVYRIEHFFQNSLHHKNNQGLKPIDIAARHGHDKVVELLADQMKLSSDQKRHYMEMCSSSKMMRSGFSVAKSKASSSFPVQDTDTSVKKTTGIKKKL